MINPTLEPEPSASETRLLETLESTHLATYRHWAKLLYPALAALASACGGAESLLPPDGCRPQVALTASTGRSPTFSWQPDCASGRLEVVHVRSGDLMWGVVGDQPSAGDPPTAIYSGVKYGEVPPGAYALGWVALLSEGQQYRVTVFSVDQRGVATEPTWASATGWLKGRCLVGSPSSCRGTCAAACIGMP